MWWEEEPDLQEITDLMISIRKRRKSELNQTPHWELDQYYEKELKQYDQE